MHRTFKAVSILLFISVLLGSCGGVTPIPTWTPTSTITPRPNVTFTPIPTHTPTPHQKIVASPTSSLPSAWEYSPLEFGESSYKLKPWTEGDYAFFINSMNNGELFDFYPIWLPVVDSYYGYEYLLHTDPIDTNDTLVWELAQMSPRGVPLPGMRSEEDYFNFLVERLLNNANVPLSELRGALKQHGFGVTNTYIAKDFYGKGDDAFFFDAVDENGYLNIGAVFAVRFVSGAYQVHTLKDWNWMFGLGTGRDYTFKGVVDANHNDLPELVIEEYEGHSGTPPSSQVTISLSEWDNQNETYRTNTFTLFNARGCRDDACNGNWRVDTTNSDLNPALVFQEQYVTQADCPELIAQRTYRWDGKEYPLEEEVILPSASNSLECELAWAETAIRIRKYGWQNDQAIQIISNALNDWPDAMDKAWGPASRDYFRLRLGIWKDLRGETSEALGLLEPLATRPLIADYPLPAHAAAAYLQSRTKDGIGKACQKANETWVTILDDGIPDYLGYPMSDKAREALGLARDNWDYSSDYISSICSEDDAIFASAQNLGENYSSSPINWFTNIGRSVYVAEQDDFNNDGTQDWLVIAQSSQGSEFSTEWFFFGDKDHFDVQELNALFDAQSSSIYKVIKPEKQGEPVYMVYSPESMWIFRVNPDQQVETLVDDFGIRILKIDQSDGIKIKVSATDWEYKGEKIKNYVWDAPSQTFVTVVEEYDFEGARKDVEQLIFQEHDYSSAILLIQQLMASAPTEYQQVESCDQDGCQYQPRIYYPSMYYLMGLAYELSGQPDAAARTYYILWRDFPDSPYALLAQHKLEPVNH